MNRIGSLFYVVGIAAASAGGAVVAKIFLSSLIRYGDGIIAAMMGDVINSTFRFPRVC